jgi:GIY-YIG catalytic domain.
VLHNILTCQDCNKKYIGQTVRPFHIRFQEHFRDFKYGNGKSKFAQHLLENRHAVSPMEGIMEVSHIKKKGNMMNTMERFRICNEIKIEKYVVLDCNIRLNSYT